MSRISLANLAGQRSRSLGRRAMAASFGAVLLAGLGACGSTPNAAFDLSAPRLTRSSARNAGVVVVPEPVALQPFESERIVVKDAAGTLSILGDGQWSDRLPRLVQTRLIQAFENSSKSRSVSRPGDGITADNQLTMEIRRFLLDGSTGEAVVELSAKLVDVKSGRVLNARIFTARTPVSSSKAAEVAPALDRSASTVFLDVIRWVGSSPQSGASASTEPVLRTGSL